MQIAISRASSASETATRQIHFHRSCGENDSGGPAAAAALAQHLGLNPSLSTAAIANDSDWFAAPNLGKLLLVRGWTGAGCLVPMQELWAELGVQQRHAPLLAGMVGCDYNGCGVRGERMAGWMHVRPGMENPAASKGTQRWCCFWCGL